MANTKFHVCFNAYVLEVYMMNEKKDLNYELMKEIEERTNIIESDSYDFGPAINKKDVTAMIVIGIICIAGLVWGVN